MSDLLKEGDIFEVTTQMNISAIIPNHLYYDNCEGDWELSTQVVNPGDKRFNYLLGSYLVTSATTERIADDMGMSMACQTYTDVHMIKAIKIDNTRIEISFYQNGNYTCTNGGVVKTGKGKIKWVVERDSDEIPKTEWEGLARLLDDNKNTLYEE